jgi:hypothetical protein
MFKTDIDLLNETVTRKLELETIQCSQDVSYLRKETHQKIQDVNSKFNSLSSSVYESLELHMSETKQNLKFCLRN